MIARADVARGIGVTIHFVAAGIAGEHPLATGDVTAHPTGRAILAGIGGRNRDHDPPCPTGLVGQLPPDLAGRNIEHPPVQTRLLRDLPTRFSDRPAGGGGHRAHVQVFDPEEAVVLDQPGRRLVACVIAAVGDMPIKPPKRLAGLLAAR